MKTLLKKSLGFMLIAGMLLITGNFSSFASNLSVDKDTERAKSREAYLKIVDQDLAKKNRNLFSRFLRARTNGETESFYIKKGNDRAHLEFYNVAHLFNGNTFTITNDASSKTDINVAFYLMKSDGTRGEKIGGRYNDIHAGESKTVSFRSMYAEERSFIVVIENDGYIWQDNVPVSGTIRAHGY